MTEEKRNRIIELYKQGFGILEVARKVQCRNTTVSSILHRAKIVRAPKHSLGRIAEERICSLYNNGTSMPETAHLVGLTLARVRAVLAKYGIDTSPKRFMSSEQIEYALELHAKKFTGAEIAEELNVTPGLVYKELNRAGTARNWNGPKVRFTRYVSANGLLVRFRSTWEAAFARYLDGRGLQWAYEAHTWLLSDGTAYTPDFWVPSLDIYFEVKGWMRERATLKLALFKTEYPQIHLEVVDKEGFRTYGIKIPNGTPKKSYRPSDDAEMTDPVLQ